jgi:serine/threonine protein kinase
MSEDTPHSDHDETVVGDRYILESRLGQGGNAEVYRARVKGDEGTYRAVKIIDIWNSSIEVSPEALKQRVQREAQALARVNSPHVLHLVDFVSLDPRRVALVMELAEGPTLQAELDAHGYLPPSRALPIAIQIAEACFEVHRQGIIHRDLKPANIILEPGAEDREFVYVLDFGTARATDDAAITSDFVGTPRYASPEQFDNGPTDGRSDVYALGVILFHVLSGQPPFDASEPIALMNQHLNETPPYLGQVMGGAHRPPDDLSNLVASMLSKDPDERPGTMRSVADRLKDISRQWSAVGAPRSTLTSQTLSDTTSSLSTGSASSGAREHTDASRPARRYAHRKSQLAAQIDPPDALRVFDTSDNGERLLWEYERSDLDSVKFSDDGYLIAVIDGSDHATIHSTQDGSILTRQPAGQLSDAFE